MQVNPKIEYNEEDAGLTLDKPAPESVEKPESCDANDEADLVAAESQQKEVSVSGSQVISSPRALRQLRADDRLIVAGCMAAGLFSVVAVYILIVFL
ncbi:MAG: hypothetical protein R8G33_05435 [Gammaproteobacteria bacterium]|nr:hypothetical protein [Gammaproteobacteria bacterium]